MRIKVRLTPNAKHQRIIKENTLMDEEIYKIYVTQKPVDNQANNALISLLSEHFKVRKGLITILQGEKSRNKIIQIGE